jgi:hypothetical protein
MTTIVSGFLSNVNVNHSIEYYYELGIKLLNINVPKILFVDEIMYEKLKPFNNEFTKIVLYDPNTSYLRPYVNEKCLTNFKTNSSNPNKDTMEYMFTICNKTEWLREAIELNYFNTPQFVWIDLAIRKVISSDELLIKYVLDLQDKSYSKVRIASIWNVNRIYNINIYTDIAWYFAGGVFGGDKDQLVLFAEKMKIYCLNIIAEKQTLMLEVNVWYLIYLENKELFDCYQCDHNDTIINNY